MLEDITLVEFIYLVCTRIPLQSYCRRLGSLFLCSWDVFRMLIYSVVR